jgi:hypothetical protein
VKRFSKDKLDFISSLIRINKLLKTFELDNQYTSKKNESKIRQEIVKRHGVVIGPVMWFD